MNNNSSSPYQTLQRISPPSFASRACRPVRIPRDVETIEIPRPPSTSGISLAGA